MGKHKPTPEEIRARHCDSCFVPFNRALPKEIEEGTQILFCSRCSVTVHRCCYDFEPACTALTTNISQFVCQKCRVETPKPPTCLICHNSQGAMKPLLLPTSYPSSLEPKQEPPKQFIHVYCALVHNQIDILSYSPSLTFRKAAHYEELTNICQICMKRNAHDNCAQESCRKKVHTYCAKSAYIRLSAQGDEPHSWNHHISTGNHGNFDISDQIIPYEILSQEVDHMLKPVLDLPLEIKELESIKRKVHKQYTDELRGKRKTTKKLRRGGFSYVLCNQHESNSYCICQSKEDGDMVLCDCCFEWYHNNCINLDPSTCKEDEPWICHYCSVFYDFKRKAIEEVRTGRNECDVARVEPPLKITFADCMWVMRVVDNRIRGGQAGKMLKELSKYPLKSSCMDLLIRQVSRTRLTTLAQQCLSGLATLGLWSELRPRVVLGLEQSGRPVVLQQNVEYNRRLRGVLECLGGVGGEVDSQWLLKALEFKQKAVSDQYETIIELCSTDQPYQEVPILKQKAQAYHYLQFAQKLNSGQPLPYPSLLLTQQKLLDTHDLPAYIFNLIRDKLQLVQPLVSKLTATIRNHPQDMQKIVSLVKQLEEQHIQPLDQYLQLKAQKKLVQDMQLYYSKHEGAEAEDVEVGETIQLLLRWDAIKPSHQLIQIVNSYLPVLQQPVWKKTPLLLQKLRKISIQFQVREILKKKMVLQDRLLGLASSVRGMDLELFTEEVRGFLELSISLKEKVDSSLSLSLQNVESYQDITENTKNIQEIRRFVDRIGVRIDDEGKNSLQKQIRTRKDELEQLMTLLTSAQLPKNPLPIQKLLPSLPKANPLVKKYLVLKKQQTVLVNKFTSYIAKISERTELFKSDSKKQRKQQIRQNNEKPSPSEIKELIQSIKQSSVEMGQEMKELKAILNNSLDIASRARKYCEEKHDLRAVKNIEELSLRRKELEDLRKRILVQAELSLKTELVDIYHLEIAIRMKNALLTPNLELEKINKLLHFAEEENMVHDEMYVQLRQRYESKNKKSKEFNQVKHVEQSLANEAARDQTPHLIALANHRRSLVLSDVSDVKLANSYVEELVEKNKSLRSKLSNILNGKLKLELQEVRPIYLEALKNPFSLPELAKLTPEINRTYDILKRWKEMPKNINLSHPVFKDYQHSLFIIQDIQKMRNQLRSNEEEISHLKFLVQTFSAETAPQMEEIVDRMESNPVIKDTQVCITGQVQYLRYWLKLINHSKNARELVSFQKLRRLILDAYNLLQKMLKRGEDYHSLVPFITQVESYLSQVKTYLRDHPLYDPNRAHIVAGFVDLQDFYLDNEQQSDLSELVPLLRPLDDIPRFRVKNLQRFEAKREESTFKRSSSKFDEARGQSEKMIQLPVSSSSSSEEEQVPQVVSDNERRKIKEIFQKNIRKNQELAKYGECEQEVKMIQNQIFGEWHNDIVKYFQMSDSFQKLFIKLIHCPNISQKMIKKKFQFKFITLLVNNLPKIDQLQAMILTKNKQEETEKKVQQAVQLKHQQQPPQNPADQDHGAKFDENAREEIKKEMKMIKEAKEGKQHKHKKKKHHKHHHHRDRYHSPEAKFSSVSEKELPKYIESQYNKEETKPLKMDSNNPRMSDSPLRYDPEEEELAKREVIHPKGSIIRIKQCSAEIQTRKLGKMEFPIDLYTEEEHRRILELLDPGFTKLTIHKHKGEADMLPYINRSRKKYKFLVGWLEARKREDNQALRELAQEAVEKKKVFGWQNEHIKIHMMGVRQLMTIPKFAAPARVTSAETAEILANDRIIFVIQYPQRLYEIRENYKQFEEIIRSTEEHQVHLPPPIPQSKPIDSGFFGTFPPVPTIRPYEKPERVTYQGWGDEPQPNQPMAVEAPVQSQHGLPSRVNQARIQFNFGTYSPINSESEDNAEDREEKEDLAAGLLNSFDVSKVAPPPAQNPPQQQKSQPYQGYYPGYAPYSHQQQRPVAMDNRWMNYPQMNPQGMQQGQNVYNPLNPMAPKYPQGGMPPPNPMSQQQYKNPMMGPRPGQQMQGGQYYDPRYQGGYQPQ